METNSELTKKREKRLRRVVFWGGGWGWGVGVDRVYVFGQIFNLFDHIAHGIFYFIYNEITFIVCHFFIYIFFLYTIQGYLYELSSS